MNGSISSPLFSSLYACSCETTRYRMESSMHLGLLEFLQILSFLISISFSSVGAFYLCKGKQSGLVEVLIQTAGKCFLIVYRVRKAAGHRQSVFR